MSNEVCVLLSQLEIHIVISFKYVEAQMLLQRWKQMKQQLRRLTYELIN